MIVSRAFALVALGVALGASPAVAARCSAPPKSPADLGIDVSAEDRCDPLVPARCLLPFPSDYFTVADRTTKTKRRVHFVEAALPANASGSHLDAAELNRADGFSPGVAALLWMPGV